MRDTSGLFFLLLVNLTLSENFSGFSVNHSIIPSANLLDLLSSLILLSFG